MHECVRMFQVYKNIEMLNRNLKKSRRRVLALTEGNCGVAKYLLTIRRIPYLYTYGKRFT